MLLSEYSNVHLAIVSEWSKTLVQIQVAISPLQNQVQSWLWACIYLWLNGQCHYLSLEQFRHNLSERKRWRENPNRKKCIKIVVVSCVQYCIHVNRIKATWCLYIKNWNWTAFTKKRLASPHIKQIPDLYELSSVTENGKWSCLHWLILLSNCSFLYNGVY